MSVYNSTANVPSIGLNLSADPYSLKEGEYSFMLNGAIHGLDGRQPFARILPGNLKRATFPGGFFPVGSTPVNHKEICYFLVNPSFGDCEIGLFNGESYTTIVRNRDLCFKINKQIQACLDEDFNGNKIVIWVQQDAPIRSMNLNKPPLLNGSLDIDALNLFKKYEYPNCRIVEIATNGRIPACALYVTLQYADENGNGLTSWTTPIGPIPIYRDSISQTVNFINGSPDREPTNKAVRLEMSNLDNSFKYYNIGVIKSFAGIREAFQVQTLSIQQSNYLYTGDSSIEKSIDLKDIINPATSYESAKTISRSNGSLLIGNLKGKKEFNLQPLISNVQVQWQLLKEEYANSEQTYANPLNCTYKMGFRRNEIYPLGFVIRWNDGTKSRVYPFISRQKNKDSAGNIITAVQDQYGTAITSGEWDSFIYPAGDDLFEAGSSYPERYKIYNTAYKTGNDLVSPEVVGQAQYGEFGFWESSERYPNDINIWGDNAGQPIRHFLMPDVSVAPLFETNNAFLTGDSKIYVLKLGLRFPNIETIVNQFPQEVLERMEGWEIVRGDRRNNKTVIASGIINNMWFQNWNDTITEGVEDIRLYNNYPLNDLSADRYILKKGTLSDNTATGLNDRYRKDAFTFISPDTEFNKAMLLSGELNIHYENYGYAKTSSYYMKPYSRMKHNTQDEDYRDIFYQMVTIGYYRNKKLPKVGNLRRKLLDALYIPFNSQVSGGSIGLPVHNLMREGTVMLHVNKEIPDPTIKDNSRSYVSDIDFLCGIKSGFKYRTISSHYASIVSRIDNQYGSIFDIRFVSTNMDNTNVKNNQIVFGGDTFMGAYSMKKQMVMYQNAQEYINFPDGSRGVDLKNSATINGTVYYYTSVPKWIADNSNSECEPNGLGTSLIKMLDQGIPVFFTESDYNMDLRLNGSEVWNTFYPNLKDGSLSVQRWTGIEFIDKPEEHVVNPAYNEPNDLFKYENPDPFYNPLEDITGAHYSTRCIFSLSNSPENQFNNLFVFKPLNYYDFRRDAGELWDIQDIGNNKILFRLEHALFIDRKYGTIPVEGNKLVLGSGKLFETEPQLLSKTDGGYIGTQSQWAFNNTPFGSFFIDPVRGNVFQMGEGPTEIGANNVDSYLAENMPLRILKDFPYFQDFDNPANPNGVGFHSVYDHFNKIWILTKRDYSLIDKSKKDSFSYNSDGQFCYNDQPVNFDNQQLFANECWTFIYSPLTQKWIGWASFIPSHYSILKTQYYSFQNGAIWEHNKGLPRTFYGKKYPFIFEGVLKSDKGEVATHNIQWVTRAFPIVNNMQQGESFDITYNKAVLYNESECTGNYKLTVQNENDLSTIFKPEEVGPDFIEQYLRRRDSSWQLGQLYNLVKDHNKPFFTQDPLVIASQYFIDKIVDNTNIAYDRHYIEKPNMDGLWLKFRLCYDKPDDIQMYTYIAFSEQEQVVH